MKPFHTPLDVLGLLGQRRRKAGDHHVPTSTVASSSSWAPW